MRRGRTMLVAAALVAAAGCGSPSVGAPVRAPVRWILVERRAGELPAEARWGDGVMDPQAVVLTLEPLDAEDVRWEVVVDPQDSFVEILEITPTLHAAPGETVTATVKVARARPNDLYRLTARVSQAGVEILGDAQRIVRGGCTAAFRFTSLVPGRAGIAVWVERLDGNGP